MNIIIIYKFKVNIMNIMLWLYGILLAAGFAVFGFWTGSFVLVNITGNPSETIYLIGGIIGGIIGILVGIGPVIVIETMKRTKKQTSGNEKK
jgi:hypothetical protein